LWSSLAAGMKSVRCTRSALANEIIC
jgi:hypothetical protein